MSGIIAIVTQPPAEGLTGGDLEALGGAAALAAETGEPLLAAVMGHDVGDAVTEAGERGAERVYVADAEHLAAFSGDAVVDAAAAIVEASDASTVVVGRGSNTLEFGPRLGARLGGGCVMGVTETRASADGGFAVVASVYGGSARAVYRLAATPRVLGLSPGLAPAPDREAGRSAEVVDVDVDAPAEERVVVDQAAEATGPRLEEANVVVSGGRGLQSGDNFALIRELAANLGGLPGLARHRGRGLGAVGGAGGADGQDREPGPLRGSGHLGREPAHDGLLDLARAGGDQHRPGRADLPVRSLRHQRRCA